MKFPYTLSDKTATVLIRGEAYLTDRSNPSWPKIKEALDDENFDTDTLISLFNPITGIEEALRGQPNITVRDGALFFDTQPDGGVPIHSVLAQRMLDIISEGLNLGPWVKFANNLHNHPVAETRGELYQWLEASDLPLASNGCFVAYKIVDENYMDIYTHTIDNSVGKTVVMRGGRMAVDPDRRKLCSSGLHFCSKAYLPHYGLGSGSRIMLLEIDPADVVAIPEDHSYAKGRTWRYKVVGEMDREKAASIVWRPIRESDSDEWDEWDDSGEEYEDGESY